MAEETLKEDDGDELIVVETTDENIPVPGEQEPGASAEPDDEDEDDDTDARLGDSEDDSDEDITSGSNKTRERRLKRRELQRRAKQRAEEEMALLRQQLAQTQQRLATVEGHALSTNEQAIMAQLAQAQEEHRQAEFIIAKATEAGNGDDVVAAMRIRDAAAARAQQLAQAQQHYAAARQQAAQPQVDPGVVNYAREWIAANSWYDPNGRDEDSRITKQIDDQLAREGWDPRTRSYWEELTRRTAEKLNGPEPQKRGGEPGGRKAPPVGGSREHAPVSTRKEVYVTPERKQAMIDAGVWDDPVRRKQMLKAYRDYDAQSAR